MGILNKLFASKLDATGHSERMAESARLELEAHQLDERLKAEANALAQARSNESNANAADRKARLDATFARLSAAIPAELAKAIAKPYAKFAENELLSDAPQVAEVVGAFVKRSHFELGEGLDPAMVVLVIAAPLVEKFPTLVGLLSHDWAGTQAHLGSALLAACTPQANGFDAHTVSDALKDVQRYLASLTANMPAEASELSQLEHAIRMQHTTRGHSMRAIEHSRKSRHEAALAALAGAPSALSIEKRDGLTIGRTSPRKPPPAEPAQPQSVDDPH